jgi:hypothetical protein
MKTVAAVCIPRVSAKISIDKPRMNPNIKVSHFGVSKGNKIINRI